MITNTPPTVGQVFRIFDFDTKPMDVEVLRVTPNVYDRTKFDIFFAPNRVGSARRFTVTCRRWAQFKPELLAVEGKSHNKPKSLRNQAEPKVVGAFGMVQRVYNSKRIVWEPARIVMLLSTPGSFSVRYLLDDELAHLSSVHSFTKLDPKWLPKKLKEIDREIAQLQNLRVYATYWLTFTKI